MFELDVRYRVQDALAKGRLETPHHDGDVDVRFL
jgi:hypothetical protein